MKVQAIIPTAGIGSRFHPDHHKPLVTLSGKPVVAHTLAVFEQCPVIESVIVVGHEERLTELNELMTKEGLKKVCQVIAGGNTRRESVGNGLACLDDDTEIVIIHDGVRPLVSRHLIEEIVKQCESWEAVITGVPVKPTIKKVNKDDLLVEQTVDRDGLWEVQTPQAFRKEILVKAHQQKLDHEPTDDAMMVEEMGIGVKVMHGEYQNIKITTLEDLQIAEALINKKDGVSI